MQHTRWRRLFRSSRRGFTLVELMIVVAIIGVLAALATYGMTRYLALAKTAEAKEAVGAISRGAVLAFQRELHESEVLNEGGDSKNSQHLLCKSADPVPMNPGQVKGVKYQPDSSVGADFNKGDVISGWQCLRYTKAEPMAYRYMYFAEAGYLSPPLGGPDPGPVGFEAVVQGDVDGDGNLSTFAIAGTISASTGEVRTASQVFIHAEDE